MAYNPPLTFIFFFGVDFVLNRLLYNTGETKLSYNVRYHSIYRMKGKKEEEIEGK